MRNFLAKIILIMTALMPIMNHQLAFADDTNRAKISDPTGTLSKSTEMKEIATSANWFLTNGPMLIAVGVILFAVVMLIRQQFVISLTSFIGGMIAAAVLKIVASIQ